MGPTKTTVQAIVWTYFLLKEEGKELIKVSSIFVKDMTRDHVENTFSCESSGSQSVYRKLFPSGPHSSKNNFFGIKTLFTWSGGPRSSGVSFFCFHALGDTKQKKVTPLDRGPPLHVNRP